MRDSIPLAKEDFCPFPAKEIKRRGVPLSRSSLIRAVKKGELKTMLFRQTGSTKGRRFILLESLDAYIDSHMEDVPMSSSEAAA